MAVVWALLVIPLSIGALLNALQKIEQGRAPLVPSCDYSVPLLIVVLLIQLVAGAFVVYWFTKCCKCARTSKAGRVATILSIIVAVLYAVIIIGFAVSVFVFVNTTNADLSSSDNAKQDDQNQVCIETSSPPFLFATFYLVALLLFLMTTLFMTCCDYQYRKKHRNFLVYLKDTVRIYANDGHEEHGEESEL